MTLRPADDVDVDVVEPVEVLLGPRRIPDRDRGGGDQVFPTIVAVAAAVVAEKLTLPELPERRAEAESALTRLGVPDSGWWAALRAAAGVEPARAEHPSG